MEKKIIRQYVVGLLFLYILLRQSVGVPRHSKLIACFNVIQIIMKLDLTYGKIIIMNCIWPTYSKQVLNLTLDKVNELQML